MSRPGPMPAPFTHSTWLQPGYRTHTLHGDRRGKTEQEPGGAEPSPADPTEGRQRWGGGEEVGLVAPCRAAPPRRPQTGEEESATREREADTGTDRLAQAGVKHRRLYRDTHGQAAPPAAPHRRLTASVPGEAAGRRGEGGRQQGEAAASLHAGSGLPSSSSSPGPSSAVILPPRQAPRVSCCAPTPFVRLPLCCNTQS